MQTPRNQWTILIGADNTPPTKNAVQHLNHVFEGIPPQQRPRLVLFHVIEQALAPGAELGEPTFAWEAGGITGMTSPICDADFDRAKDSSIHELLKIEEILLAAGWSANRIRKLAVPGGFSKALIADVIAYHAREEKARVVVVGRTRHGRLHEALLKSIGERLTHYLPGITVWVVGSSDDEDQQGSDSNSTPSAESN